ncbi:MAG: hypothetical protein NC132_03930 [Corallococcus sp.]|nr:hypothetical protein [Corallococcus sp.]MCM1359808.1 hypothetical protein [Corallococcus sp.]MCM1395242.1 hypothetical protein [Corallococcus sp.]
MKIAIIDDGAGAFATFNKLKYGVSADYSVYILDAHFPLGKLSKAQLTEIAKTTFDRAVQDGCDTVVFSSIALAVSGAKQINPPPEISLFGCEAPVLHASTYTASKVLVAGDLYTAQFAKRFPSVIPVALSEFPLLAENFSDDKKIVSYISECAERFYGSFDCIALANSSMNLYKHCFSRVFPNAQIFDSLEGVARKLRKKCKKNTRESSTLTVVGEQGEDLMQKYKFFADEFC